MTRAQPRSQVHPEADSALVIAVALDSWPRIARTTRMLRNPATYPDLSAISAIPAFNGSVNSVPPEPPDLSGRKCRTDTPATAPGPLRRRRALAAARRGRSQAPLLP